MHNQIAQTKPKELMLLLTVSMTGMLAFLQVYSIQSILPVLQAQMGLSAVGVGSLVGATVLAVALISPFMGMISDALGRRVFIIGAVFLLAVPTLGISFAQTESQLWWLRFFQGLLVPSITVVLIAFVGEEFSGHLRLRLMSFYVTGTVLGGFLGRFLVGYMTELWGWQVAYYVMASFSLFGGVALLVFLPRSQHFQPKPHVKQALWQLAHHIRNPHLIAACLLGFCVMYSLVGCFTYINLRFAVPPYDLNAAQLANVFVVYLVGMVVTPLSAWLIARYGVATTATGAVLLSMFGVVLTTVSPLWLIIVALMLMCSGVFITQGATISFISMNVPEGRSLASGLYYMSYYAGGTTGTFICGLAYEVGQWSYTVIALLIMQGIALVTAHTLLRRAKSSA